MTKPCHGMAIKPKKPKEKPKKMWSFNVICLGMPYFLYRKGVLVIHDGRRVQKYIPLVERAMT